MRLAILTSNQLRHKYFANRLIEKFNVVGIFSEEKSFDPNNKETIKEKIKNQKEKTLWRWHFNLRDAAEKFYFVNDTEFKINSRLIINIPKGEINNEAYVKKIKKVRPDIIVVFGTGLLREKIIDICPKKIINMHLGLSPYYRGSATNFWPLHDDKPEYVGVTIHFLDKGIDSGDIIHQGRPEIKVGDNQHSIGCKTIIVGTQLMIKTIEQCMKNKLKSFPQNKEKGKLYFRKDFSIKNVKKLKKILEEGLIEKYLKRKDAVFKKIKIIP
ncbi:MAG: formyl transferase [Patescibacteria group bacterium]